MPVHKKLQKKDLDRRCVKRGRRRRRSSEKVLLKDVAFFENRCAAVNGEEKKVLKRRKFLREESFVESWQVFDSRCAAVMEKRRKSSSLNCLRENTSSPLTGRKIMWFVASYILTIGIQNK